MPHPCSALVALAGACRLLPAAAQAWYHQKQHPGPTGDFTPKERAALQRLDPGIEGSSTSVGSAQTSFDKQLRQHGGEPNTYVGVYPSSEWESRAGVKVLEATPRNISGSMVVRTDHGLMPAPPMWAKVAWRLQDRPRRMALMVIEMIEEYRPYLGHLALRVAPLVCEFRAQGLPVLFSNWVRRPGDGLYGGLDRAMGPKGMSTGMNVQYTFKDGGLFPMKELAPTEAELRAGHLIKSIHLNKFADLDAGGRSALSEKLRALGMDTLVLVGGWTDACIAATAVDAVDAKNLDVVVASDAVGTATAHQRAALETIGWMVSMQTSGDLLAYMKEHKGDAAYVLPPRRGLAGDLASKYSPRGSPSIQAAGLPMLTLATAAFVLGLPLLALVAALRATRPVPPKPLLPATGLHAGSREASPDGPWSPSSGAGLEP